VAAGRADPRHHRIAAHIPSLRFGRLLFVASGETVCCQYFLTLSHQ
jgi:hypothetical protein